MNSKYIIHHMQKFAAIVSNLTKQRVLAPGVSASGQSVFREIPDDCTPDEYTLHMARNYWKQFNHNNSIYSPVTVQHAVVDHLYLMSQIPEKNACSYLAEVLTRAGRNRGVFRMFINTYGQRLCDPVSPVCNPSLFIRAAGLILNQAETPEDYKSIVRHWLKLACNTDTESSINNMYNIG